MLIVTSCRFRVPVKSSLVEPDRRIYRIRLSDKTSRLHPRLATTKLGQAYEPEVLVNWLPPAFAGAGLYGAFRVKRFFLPAQSRP